jgi:FlaA1/EpsC-like NDP-sugar epimerase
MQSVTRFAQRLAPRTRHACCAALSVPVFAAIHALAYWLRFDGLLGLSEWRMFSNTVVTAILVKVIIFAAFRIYQGWNRYVTFHDLISLLKASIVSSLLMLLANYLLLPRVITARSVFLLDLGLTIVIVGGLRSLLRLLEEGQRSVFLTLGRKPVFIVGTNDSGEALLRSIRRNPKLPYWVAGFVTEDHNRLQSHIAGVPVLGSVDETCELARQYDVAEVLITAGELSGQQVRRLVDEGAELGIDVKVLPSYEQLLHGAVNLRPRQVSIEDLLRREPVQLDMSQLHRWLEDQVVLVTGSAGSIGSEICRQLLQFSPKRLIALDRSENGQFFLERELRALGPEANIEICLGDLNDATRMRQVFQAYRPVIVFHAAAYKHVPLMEAHPGEAVKNITLASCQLADMAHRHGVSSFVMISTDKAVNPTSVMGTCKRAAELYVQALAKTSPTCFVTVRFGNVLDSAGSVIPIFREQIARGGPVTVTHPEMRRFFMTIPEASQLVIQAGAMGRGGEIFVLDMGEPVKVIDLARDMIHLSGLEVGRDIEIAFTGTRPGEKLFEELQCDGERRLPTKHAKILVAESKQTEFEELHDMLQHLEQITDGPADAILDTLQHIVPQYQSADPSRHARSVMSPKTLLAHTKQPKPAVPAGDILPIGHASPLHHEARRRAA